MATGADTAMRRPPQLRHVSAASTPRSPAPRPQNHFLRDSDSILEAALEARDTSYWCLLERSDAKRKAEVQPPSDRIGPRLTVYGVGLGPNDPYSGLTVTYAVLKDYNSDRRIQPPLWLINGYATIRYECAVSDPFDARRKPMEFADVILCGGKYYSVSLQGVVVAMEVIDTRLQIAAVGSTRAVPYSRSLKFFKEYLVEMDEEILIVYLIHHESVEVVDDVEVYRLDLDRLELIKVERLQGRTMFLKESRYEWVDSAEYGCRDNCVFFTEGKEKKWRVYDFKTCCISSL